MSLTPFLDISHPHFKTQVDDILSEYTKEMLEFEKVLLLRQLAQISLIALRQIELNNAANPQPTPNDHVTLYDLKVVKYTLTDIIRQLTEIHRSFEAVKDQPQDKRLYTNSYSQENT